MVLALMKLSALQFPQSLQNMDESHRSPGIQLQLLFLLQIRLEDWNYTLQTAREEAIRTNDCNWTFCLLEASFVCLKASQTVALSLLWHSS